jgi:hypothetical protein
VTVPPCHYCGKEIDRLEFVYTVDHMLRVQKTKLTHADDPRSARVPVGAPFWVCGEHHRPDEAILEVVKTGEAERARLARPPATSAFWPRGVVNYDDLREGGDD